MNTSSTIARETRRREAEDAARALGHSRAVLVVSYIEQGPEHDSCPFIDKASAARQRTERQGAAGPPTPRSSDGPDRFPRRSIGRSGSVSRTMAGAEVRARAPHAPAADVHETVHGRPAGGDDLRLVSGQSRGVSQRLSGRMLRRVELHPWVRAPAERVHASMHEHVPGLLESTATVLQARVRRCHPA